MEIVQVEVIFKKSPRGCTYGTSCSTSFIFCISRNNPSKSCIEATLPFRGGNEIKLHSVWGGKIIYSFGFLLELRKIIKR